MSRSVSSSHGSTRVVFEIFPDEALDPGGVGRVKTPN
jgi:hypothetical protein